MLGFEARCYESDCFELMCRFYTQCGSARDLHIKAGTMNRRHRTRAWKNRRLALTLVIASAAVAACSMSDNEAATGSQTASALTASPADPENRTQVSAGEQIYQTH